MKKLALLLALVVLVAAIPAAPALADHSVYADTPLSGSTRARLNNIRLAAEAIDGIRMDYGDTFSFNDIVGPRSTRYGYQSAINGRGVKVVGGGVAQVASTIYLALKQLDDGIDYQERQTYGRNYNGKYVDSHKDAILVDYDDADFRFVNNYGAFEIKLWIDSDVLSCVLLLRGNGRAIGSASFDIDGNRATRVNVTLAADSIYDTQLCYGDEFSFNDIVGPRTAKYGFKNALNGRGVNVCGGGVAQVASAIYMAVKNLNCVRVTEKSTYGSNYTQTYVSNARDAILVDYNAKTDFKFKYLGDGTLSVNTYVSGTSIVCDVYEAQE